MRLPIPAPRGRGRQAAEEAFNRVEAVAAHLEPVILRFIEMPDREIARDEARRIAWACAVALEDRKR